jgi:hypothetical protein
MNDMERNKRKNATLVPIPTHKEVCSAINYHRYSLYACLYQERTNSMPLSCTSRRRMGKKNHHVDPRSTMMIPHHEAGICEQPAGRSSPPRVPVRTLSSPRAPSPSSTGATTMLSTQILNVTMFAGWWRRKGREKSVLIPHLIVCASPQDGRRSEAECPRTLRQDKHKAA